MAAGVEGRPPPGRGPEQQVEGVPTKARWGAVPARPVGSQGCPQPVTPGLC